MLALIQQKVDGQDIAVPPEERPEAKIVDLMEALKASVGDRKPAGRAPERGEGPGQAPVPQGGERRAQGGEFRLIARATRRISPL